MPAKGLTMANKIAALVFDAYGTLFDVHSVTETCERLFPGKGGSLSQLWRTKQLEYTWQRSLMGRYADFNRVTEDGLCYACGALALRYSQSALDTLMEAYRHLQPFPDAVAALTALKARARLAILSNGTPAMLQAVVASSGLTSTFDAVLSVDAAGIFKPAPRVYQLAVDHLGMRKEEIGFVSSNGWDAAGAKAFGFQVFWINRAALPVEELDVKPDAELKSLDDLLATLNS
jgi:2-haloacid dehalogenase